MEARLPLVKVQRIQGILQEFNVKKSCNKRELLSLLGHLNFASRVVRPGRTFTELYHHVRITAELRLD